MKPTASKKPRRSEGVSSPRAVDPFDAIARLERRACADQRIARLTIGLFDSIECFEQDRLFPGYIWQQRDVREFPRGLQAAAQALITWGQDPKAGHSVLFASRKRIKASVFARRAASPAGKKWIEIAERIRREHPARTEAFGTSRDDAPRPTEINVLPEMVGLPLTGLTVRMAQSLHPKSIQVSALHEPLWCSGEPPVTVIQLNPDLHTVRTIFMIVPGPPVIKASRIEGYLEDYSATGTEGAIWTLQDDENTGYSGMHLIEEGDHLTITDQLGHRIWAGVIRCDRRSGLRRRPGNPEFQQPCALGHWIHWTQRGFKPDDWARFFLRPDYDRLRGALIKKPHRNAAMEHSAR